MSVLTLKFYYHMKFGIIKERKNPPDRRVVFSPEKLVEAKAQFPQAEFVVESSDIRVFIDEAYRKHGFEVKDDVSDCDVLLGVKEVPLDALVPNKKYFFFSHTIKQQPYNRKLLVDILKKNIELYDHETIVKQSNSRLIGFGRYAGLVGAYNGFRALGLRDGLFKLPKVETLADLNEVKAELDKITLPSLKILLSGTGKVAMGAKEILDHLKIKLAKKRDAILLFPLEKDYLLEEVLTKDSPINPDAVLINLRKTCTIQSVFYAISGREIVDTIGNFSIV